MKQIKKKKKKNAFTLVELLAVIVLLGIVMTIGVLAVNKIQSNTKKKAFYTEVLSIVENLQKNTALDENEYCFYDLDTDTANKNDLIDKMYVIIQKNDTDTDSKTVSVYASMNNTDAVIDVADYKKDKYDNTEKEDYEDSYTSIAAQLIGDEQTSGSATTATLTNISKFKMCNYVGGSSNA